MIKVFEDFKKYSLVPTTANTPSYHKLFPPPRKKKKHGQTKR